MGKQCGNEIYSKGQGEAQGKSALPYLARLLSLPEYVWLQQIFFYGNDILLFCRCNISNARTLSRLLALYGDIFEQKVNFSKSFIYFYSTISSAFRLAILDQIGMQLVVYLGVPLFKGKPQTHCLQPIADKIMV